MNKVNKILPDLRFEALKSDVKTKMAAAIIDKKSVYCGHNSIKRSLICGHFDITIHAEISACISAGLGKYIKNRSKPKKKYDIFIIRLTAEGDLTCARPCEECFKILLICNIDKVYYSDFDGKIKMEKTKFMDNFYQRKVFYY